MSSPSPKRSSGHTQTICRLSTAKVYNISRSVSTGNERPRIASLWQRMRSAFRTSRALASSGLAQKNESSSRQVLRLDTSSRA